MLGIILLGAVVSGLFIVMAFNDAKKFCEEKKADLKVLRCISGVLAMIIAYIMVGNYVVSPLLAQGVINGQLRYSDVAEKSSVWINMDVVDELMKKNGE